MPEPAAARERGPVLLGVMLSVGLVAIDATILSTAVPSVVQDLGGFSQFPWLFSIYLLAQAISVPLYGKFSDILGRKPMMLLGIALFLLGSVVDYEVSPMHSKFTFRNPNQTDACGCGESVTIVPAQAAE